jgi:hypothetical protein
VLGELVAGLMASSAFGRLRDAAKVNPFAPTLPGQARIAAAQATGLRAGMSGLAGSERDYYTDPQGASTIGRLGAVQDVTSRRLPVSTFVAGDPGADGKPLLAGDFYRGPVSHPAWGGNARTIHNNAQRVRTATLLPPGERTPRADEVLAARAAGAPAGEHDALSSYWEG